MEDNSLIFNDFLEKNVKIRKLRGVASKRIAGAFLQKSKVSIMYARVECYFLYKGGDVLHHDSKKP